MAVLPSRSMVLPDLWAALQAGAADHGAKWERDYPRKRLAAFFERENISFVDTTEQFRRFLELTKRSPFFTIDPHLTVAGHGVLADALEPALAKRIGGLQ